MKGVVLMLLSTVVLRNAGANGLKAEGVRGLTFQIGAEGLSGGRVRERWSRSAGLRGLRGSRAEELRVLRVPWAEGLRSDLHRISTFSGPQADLLFQEPEAPIQRIDDPLLARHGVELCIKREDLIHPLISGNKWRKLKYNCLEALSQGKSSILTFGGAYSNHVAATAAAARLCGLTAVGVIRGEEFEGSTENPTLNFARTEGMILKHISRQEFRELRGIEGDWQRVAEIEKEVGSCHVVPEGGANLLGLVGCAEILIDVQPQEWDAVALACGTASTLAGLAAGTAPEQKLLGFPALKGAGFLRGECLDLLGQALGADELQSHQDKIHLNLRHHFGGYGKVTPDLVQFIRRFYEVTGIKLDPIYTSKMMFGIYKEAEQLRGLRILAIHTGGLQGVQGIEKKLREPLFPE